METKKFLIIDGSAIAHRAFHAMPPFTSPDGAPTNAVYGFIKMLLSLIEKIRPQFIAVCFDTPVPTFRKKLLATYQAHRPKAPEEFNSQIPVIHKFLACAGITLLKKEGYEADDVIGTVVHRTSTLLGKVHLYIVTGDKDMLQLVNREVTVIMPRHGVQEVEFVDVEQVERKLGVIPQRVPDYKALVGDPSDNYPGVRGIGPKKAHELLQQYHTFQEVYRHINELDERTKKLLTEYRQDAELSYTLACIKTDVDIVLEQESLMFQGIQMTESLEKFLDKLAFKSIKKQLATPTRKVEEAKQVDKTVDNQLSFF